MTTKTLKASSGRPLSMHVSPHGSILWPTLHPKPRSVSCLIFAFCDTMPWVLVSWCICTAILTHTKPGQTSAVSMPPALSPRPVQRSFSWCLLQCLFPLHLTQVLWHGPGFLHGALVWNYFLAYGDFLGRGGAVGVGIPLPLLQEKTPSFS